MSTSQYSRGKQKNRAAAVETLVRSKQITRDGADWLTLRLDPYHDFERPISGYPDADTFDTIVSCFNYETTITKPAGAAANWDAHIFTLPITSAAFTVGSTAAGNFVAGTDVYNLGLVNIAKADAGQAMFPNLNPVVATNFSVAQIDNFTALESGLSRVIGFGIEVIDTSAMLSKQGALVAYKMPTTNPLAGSIGYLNNAGTLQTNLNAKYLPSPPVLVSEAIQYKSAVTWEAKEGAYMAVGQVGVENPITAGAFAHLGISPTGTSVSGVHLVSNPTATTALQAPPLLTSVYGQAVKFVNCTQSGIFLSGLANEASFKLRVRVYLERAPLKIDTDLVPLATPSPAYDYKALAMYSGAASMLPVAVPVHFNAKGDWWKWIVRVIGAIAPSLGAVLNPVLPGAALVGSAVSGLAGAITKTNNRPNPKKKK